MTVSLRKEKKEQLSCLVRKIINKKFRETRKLAQIIGKIVAALPGSRFGALYYRGLDINKQYGLKKSKYNCEAYVELFQESITELTWWRENPPNMFNKISEDSPNVNIYSDASGTGWDQCIVSYAWPMHGQPCLASKNFEKNNIHIQGQKLNASILKYGKLLYFQKVVNLYLTQTYNAISKYVNDTYVGVNYGTIEGAVNKLLGYKKVTNGYPRCN